MCLSQRKLPVRLRPQQVLLAPLLTSLIAPQQRLAAVDSHAVAAELEDVETIRALAHGIARGENVHARAAELLERSIPSG